MIKIQRETDFAEYFKFTKIARPNICVEIV